MLSNALSGLSFWSGCVWIELPLPITSSELAQANQAAYRESISLAKLIGGCFVHIPRGAVSVWVSVASAQETPALDAAVDEADQIIVTGRAQRLYRTETTTVGKSTEDPLDILQALKVIKKDLVADQGARDATDIYRNISGVSFFSYAGGHLPRISPGPIFL